MDNNASECAICIGKKNWEMIDTIHGANSSAIIYSIAETAKANNLKPYEYFEYLLTEIPKHMEDTNRDFLTELLPWAKTLPEHIRKPEEKWTGRKSGRIVSKVLGVYRLLHGRSGG